MKQPVSANNITIEMDIYAIEHKVNKFSNGNGFNYLSGWVAVDGFIREVQNLGDGWKFLIGTKMPKLFAELRKEKNSR